MGAHFHLPLQVDVDTGELAAMLHDVPHIFAAVGTAQTSYDRVAWHGRVALLIGNEAQGLTPEVLRLATSQIAIPMAGRAESLNAAVAGSIILFEALRQRRQSEGQV
jgi:TrmH family RNA methyltransferase